MLWMWLGGIGARLIASQPQQPHNSLDVLAINIAILPLQLLSNLARTQKRPCRINLVDTAHELYLGGPDRYLPVVVTGTRNVQQPALSSHRQTHVLVFYP